MEKLMTTLIHRRWLMVTIFVLLSGVGIYAWKQLAIDAYPDIAEITVGVVTQVPGLAAEEIEQQITIPLERELNGTPRMKMMRSKNFFGLSTILLIFEDGTDDYWARQRVQERINNVDLPFDATPELNPLTSPTGEIFRYIVTCSGKDVACNVSTLRELTELNRWIIIPRLKQIQGVADVSNFGGLTTQFQIEIDPNKLLKYNISLGEVTESIERNNSNAGGSMLIRGDLSYVVRGVGLIHDLQDLGNIVVKTVGGTPVYIKDLGELKYGNLERKGILGFVDDHYGYDDGVEGMVQMLRYENPSQILKQIHQIIDELNNDILPKNVKIHPFMDRTHLVDATLHTVSHTLLFGILLVIGILILFLGSPKSALLATITIPISLLIAFILMWFTDIPANLLSLGAIDFGIIVDGTIVMMETILKKRERNPDELLDERTIAKRVSEVAKPIFFATLIIIVAYLPLFAFSSVEKRLFTPMAFTLSFALLGALAAALILIPGLAFAIYRKPKKVYHNRWLERLTEIYKHNTAKIIDAPRKIIIPVAIILSVNIGLSVYVGKDFLPPLDEGSIWLQVALPPGISLEKSSEMATTLRHKLKQFDEVTYVMTQTGRDDEGVDPFPSSHIEISVGLKPYNTWKKGRRKSDLIADMSAMVEKMPGYDVGFSQPIIDMVMDQIAGAHSDLAIKIYGEDMNESRSIAEKVKEIVENIDGSADVAIEQPPPMPQLQIIADRNKIAQYGLNVADVAELIEVAIGGKAISQVFIDNKVYDVTCRYNETSRNTPEKIGALTLTSTSGAMIPLSTVADIKTTIGASTITREMNRRFTTVRVNLRGRDLTSFTNETHSTIEKQIKYDHTQFQIRWDGQLENQQRAYSRLALLVPMTLAVMFILLFFTFGKFRQAGLLIGMLPLVIFGSMLALVVRGMTFNVSSAVGFIALFGLSIQNGVIMLSHINILRKRGTELKQAVIAGASHRLRPMMMTATVAIFGLMPASLATNIGSDVQRPLATVIVYGLLAGTIITLYLLPTLYYLMEKRVCFNKKLISSTCIIAAIIFCTQTATAQRILTYNEYIKNVREKNIEYLVEKYNISIAEANAQAAKVTPDPELSFAYENSQDRTAQMGQVYAAELGYTLELGGKRHARMAVALSEQQMTEALVEDFFRNLRADATLCYLEALKQKQLVSLSLSSYQSMRDLARGDSLRYVLGEVAEVDAMQSRLEATTLMTDYFQTEADYKNMLSDLVVFEGGTAGIDSIADVEMLSETSLHEMYNLNDLIELAQNNRADLKAAFRYRELSAANLKLAKANRVIDLGLNIGFAHNTVAFNEEAPSPKHNTISAGISIPLKFSNSNKGELRAAQYFEKQTEAQYDAVLLQIRKEVEQCYNSYISACRQVELYQNSTLTNAATILEKKKYSYSRGETSLLEVLDAQRTANEVYQNYYEVIYHANAALVELCRVVGIWDIEF